MNYHQLLLEVQDYTHAYFNTNQRIQYVYHNINHTEGVAAAAQQISLFYQLQEREYFIVVCAAWFHDIGYFTNPAHHEAESALLAEQFLKDRKVDETVVEEIKKCIAATHMPQQPSNLLEQIVCDADLFHFGSDQFAMINKALLQEIEAVKGIKIPKSTWRHNTILLLEQHHYHTPYVQQLQNEGKNKQITLLKNKELQKRMEANTAARTMEVDAKKDKSKPDRGIETMFRITANNNQRLSDMADNKAHIMITVNSIILSAIISLLLGRIGKQEYLAIPTYLILTVSVTAIIFSILATRPSLPSGKFTKQDIEDKKVNLLFFGNFYKMKLEDYADGMWKVMGDKDFLYGTLIKDVYTQGIVLGRKYRLLRISYSIFMFGLVISVLAFVIASVLHQY